LGDSNREIFGEVKKNEECHSSIGFKINYVRERSLIEAPLRIVLPMGCHPTDTRKNH